MEDYSAPHPFVANPYTFHSRCGSFLFLLWPAQLLPLAAMETRHSAASSTLRSSWLVSGFMWQLQV